jgi:dTDP-4-amino-4,6-dideoxygalactose transaminase
MSLLALELRPGDIVLVTAYSWPATANVIELCGAQPAFVDICPDTFNMNPAALESALNDLMSSAEIRRRVKAILPVHTFGQIADMTAILEVADRFQLPVIEDAACSLGSTLDGRQAGAWGEFGCFSFHPRKAITTGEGGIITTNNDDVARHLRALRNHGLDPSASSPDFVMPGFNNRMTEFQAAFGLTQMTKLDRVIAARRAAAAHYNELLAGSKFQTPFVDKLCSHVYQSYVVLLPDELREHRPTLLREAKENGIEMTIGTWHIPMTTYYRSRYGFKIGDFPVTDQVFACSVTLPLYEGISMDDQAKVVEFLLEQLSS